MIFFRTLHPKILIYLFFSFLSESVIFFLFSSYLEFVNSENVVFRFVSTTFLNNFLPLAVCLGFSNDRSIFYRKKNKEDEKKKLEIEKQSALYRFNIEITAWESNVIKSCSTQAHCAQKICFLFHY